MIVPCSRFSDRLTLPRAGPAGPGQVGRRVWGVLLRRLRPFFGAVMAGAVWLLFLARVTAASYVPEVQGGPLGGGWCAACGADQPADHDFTHRDRFKGAGAGAARPGQPRYNSDTEARKCYDLALSHFNAGRWDEAQQAAFQALTHKWENAQAHRICARAIHLHYSDLDARGIKHLAVDWRRDAITHYRAALQYDPTLKDVSVWLEQLTQETAEQERQRQAAWEAMHPEIQGSRAYNQGMDYLKKGQWQDAELAFRLATTYNPKDPEGWWKLGYVLFRLDRFTEAEQAYIRGIQLEPHHTAYEALAVLYCRMGRYDMAIMQAQWVIMTDSANSAEAHGILAHAYWRQGNLGSAEAAYRKSIELDGKRVWVHDNLGEFLEQQGRFEDAVKCYQKAMEIDPNNKIAQSHLERATKQVSFERWAKEYESQRPPHLQSVQDALRDLVHGDTSVVDLRDLQADKPVRLPEATAGGPEAVRSLKLVDVPSPSGYRSEQERRQQLAKLTDAQIDRQIEHMDTVLKRMKDEFLQGPEALKGHLEQAQGAEREALMACFQDMAGASLAKWAQQWDKVPKAKALAEQGLRYLSYEQPVQDWLKDPKDVAANLDLARNCLLDLYDLVQDLKPDRISDGGPPAAALASFLVDYSYQVSRWTVEREQIRILTDNLDRPNGGLAAQKAIGGLYEDMVQERRRRSQTQAEALVPKGADE